MLQSVLCVRRIHVEGKGIRDFYRFLDVEGKHHKLSTLTSTTEN